jgi:hypothetical protein
MREVDVGTRADCRKNDKRELLVRLKSKLMRGQGELTSDDSVVSTAAIGKYGVWIGEVVSVGAVNATAARTASNTSLRETILTLTSTTQVT